MGRIQIAREDHGRPDALERAVDRASRKRAIEEAVAAERERCAKLVPTTWLDPLLSGDGVRNLPWGCPEIEALLRSVRDRILGASQ